MSLFRSKGVETFRKSTGVRGYRGVILLKPRREPERTDDLTTRISQFLAEGKTKYEVCMAFIFARD